MEQCGKKRIQKKLPKVLSFQQLLHIYSKWTACVNRYIVPLINWIKNNILSEEDKKYLEYLRQIISVIKDDNSISDEATYYWYAGIIIPTTANISNIAIGRTNEKPYWDAQNIKAVNTSNNSSYLYYCFPTEWNIKILDSDKITEMSLTYIASFTHNNVEYIVKRTGRTISSGASKQYYAQCH